MKKDSLEYSLLEAEDGSFNYYFDVITSVVEGVTGIFPIYVCLVLLCKINLWIIIPVTLYFIYKFLYGFMGFNIFRVLGMMVGVLYLGLL